MCTIIEIALAFTIGCVGISLLVCSSTYCYDTYNAWKSGGHDDEEENHTE